MMSCYVMSCKVMSCYVISWYVMLCYVMSCKVMSCYVISWYVMSCYDMSWVQPIRSSSMRAFLRTSRSTGFRTTRSAPCAIKCSMSEGSALPVAVRKRRAMKRRRNWTKTQRITVTRARGSHCGGRECFTSYLSLQQSAP